MDEHFSASVLDRLPAAIQKMDPLHQKVFVYLRLRKREEEVHRLLDIAPDKAEVAMRQVREVLVRSGQLDLIEDPQFVSLHHEDPDSGETRDLPFASGDLDLEHKLIIRELITILKKVIDDLPPHQSQLLKLRYRHNLSAKEIVGFLKKLNVNLIPGKEAVSINEQDIFYALNTTLKELLRRLRDRYKDGAFLCPDKLKYILEEVEI